MVREPWQERRAECPVYLEFKAAESQVRWRPNCSVLHEHQRWCAGREVDRKTGSLTSLPDRVTTLVGKKKKRKKYGRLRVLVSSNVGSFWSRCGESNCRSVSCMSIRRDAWKPNIRSSDGETRATMHSFFLECCTENQSVRPSTFHAKSLTTSHVTNLNDNLSFVTSCRLNKAAMFPLQALECPSRYNARECIAAGRERIWISEN